MADSASCGYSCSADGLVPVGIWYRVAVVTAFDDDRIVFAFCYRCVESVYFYPVPLLVRQSAQALLDAVWFRPTASSNGSDIYMVFSCSLKISFCTFWACQRTNNRKTSSAQEDMF